MSIRVGKYDFRSKKQPITESYKNILIHVHDDLSPYTLKDDNENIIENVWQFSKVYKQVYNINTTLPYKSTVLWKWPTETHVDDNGELTHPYWNWRNQGFHNKYAVRYPNGFHHRHECLYSVLLDPITNEYEELDYITARKKIYCTEYIKAARKHPTFYKYKKLLQKGVNLQFNEVDGPRYTDQEPYCYVENDSLEMNKEILEMLLNNPSQPFGHGYTLALALLDLDEILII